MLSKQAATTSTATPIRAGPKLRRQNAAAMGNAQDNMIGILSIAAAMRAGAERDAISERLRRLHRHPVHLTHPPAQAADVRVTTATK